MASLTCPHCKALSTFTEIWRDGITPPYQHAGDYVVGMRCANDECRMPLTAVRSVKHGVVFHWPQHVGGKAFPDVPPPIAATANEAHQCLSINASRGAVALARAVVESVAKAHGVTSGVLTKKIDKLAELGVISENMRDAAHEIRFAGNEVAHGDLVDEPISCEEASEVLTLMDAILMRVYQEPAQVARVRERRRERTAEAPSVQVEIS